MGGREGGAKVKVGLLVGGLGERRSSYTQRDPPTGRGPAGMGETLGVCVEEWKERSQCFPCPLRHQGGCWAPGPNPLPWQPPSCHEEPKPRPYAPPISTLGDPLQRAGPKPHPHTLTQGLISKLRNSTLQTPFFGRAASPLPCRS